MAMTTTPPPSSSTSTSSSSLPTTVVELEDPCDYLVVGAGAMGMAFCDTLIAQQPNCRIVLVDRHAGPGGHWNDDYGFIHLHQASLVYGVASKQLEGNWLKLLLTGTLPWKHRASKPELLEYYQGVVDTWVSQGNVRYYPNTNFDFSSPNKEGKEYTFVAQNSATAYRVTVNVKLVDAVQGEGKIPSKYPPAFDVDPKITIWTPNDLHLKDIEAKSSWGTTTTGSWLFQKQPETSNKKYVVIGCGKTGMDTVIYLQKGLRVPPKDIIWIVSNDVWMFNRGNNAAEPSVYSQALLRSKGNHEAAMDDMEARGELLRLDPDVRPTASFRFPAIGHDELILLRKVNNKVRRGRITSISVKEGKPLLRFGSNSGDILHLDGSVDSFIFLHCSSPGPFNENRVNDIFTSDSKLTLAAVFAPPIPLSGATLAFIESARRLQSLDMDFARKLVGDDETATNASENEILRRLVRGWYPGGDPMHQLLPIFNLATILAIVDQDPHVVAKWLTSNNRLSMFYWMVKLKSVENLNFMLNHQDEFQFPETDVRLMTLLLEKLKPLEGH